MWMSTVIFSCRFFFAPFFFSRPASRAPQNISLSRNFFVLVPGPLGTAADWFLLQGMPINNASCARRRPCCCCCYLEDCCSRHTGEKNHVLSFWLFGSERVLLFDMCLLSVGWFKIFFFTYRVYLQRLFKISIYSCMNVCCSVFLRPIMWVNVLLFFFFF